MPRRYIAPLSVAIGFGLWLVCKGWLGFEPWDASLLGYCLVLALAGAACTWLAQPPRWRDLWLWPACIVLGQLLYMLTRPDSWSLWPLSLLAFGFFGLAAVAGAAVARVLRLARGDA